MKILIFELLILILITIGLSTCTPEQRVTYELEQVAESEQLWTGVAVSKEGRIFVNYPRWSDNVPISVAEIAKSGEIIPYPDERWNSWQESLPVSDYFVCVQSVYIDKDNYLWILDTGLDIRRGIVTGGPKLLKFNLKNDALIQKIDFNTLIAPQASYLNDIRVDTKRGFAYLTDSGLGAIVVINLKSGESRRLLTNHHSTQAEDITLVIEGKEWLRPDSSKPQIHSDGLALAENGQYLYYQALTGHSLYRINTEYLRDFSITETQLGEKVELMGQSGASDAIAYAPDGSIYLTSIEHNAIRRFTANKKVEMVIQHEQLKWPDSFAITPDGTIYVTTSQLHLGPARIEPYKIFKMKEIK